VVREESGVPVIRSIAADDTKGRAKYSDMPLADLKLLILLNPFEPRDGRKTSTDYNQLGKMADWVWKDDYADPFCCLIQATRKYNVTIGNAKNRVYRRPERPDLSAMRDDFKYRVCLNDQTIYTWTSSAFGVFQIRGDHLYCAYGNFRIRAVDLSTGKELWDYSLVGLGPSNEIPRLYPLNLYSNSDVIVVFGTAPRGRFLEIKDAKTGKTIGHKTFRALRTEH